eukprot:gene26968-biopygen17542
MSRGWCFATLIELIKRYQQLRFQLDSGREDPWNP